MDNTKLAYLAGLIDGEGTISVTIDERKSGVSALHKVLAIFNTNDVLINWIKENFGGTIHKRDRGNGWKPEYQLKWKAEDASVLLKMVLPYLVTKKEQAELFMALHATKTSKQITEEIKKLRRDMVDRCHALNKRGRNS